MEKKHIENAIHWMVDNREARLIPFAIQDDDHERASQLITEARFFRQFVGPKGKQRIYELFECAAKMQQNEQEIAARRAERLAREAGQQPYKLIDLASREQFKLEFLSAEEADKRNQEYEDMGSMLSWEPVA